MFSLQRSVRITEHRQLKYIKAQLSKLFVLSGLYMNMCFAECLSSDSDTVTCAQKSTSVLRVFLLVCGNHSHSKLISAMPIELSKCFNKMLF